MRGYWAFPGPGQWTGHHCWQRKLVKRVRLCPKCWALQTVLGSANSTRLCKQYLFLQIGAGSADSSRPCLFLCSVVVIGWQPNHSTLLLWLLSYSGIAPCTWRAEISVLGLGRFLWPKRRLAEYRFGCDEQEKDSGVESKH